LGVLTVHTTDDGQAQSQAISATRTGTLSSVTGTFEVGEELTFPDYAGAGAKLLTVDGTTVTYHLTKIPIVLHDGERGIAMPYPPVGVAIQGATSGATATLTETDSGGDAFPNTGGEIVLAFLLNDDLDKKFYVIARAQKRIMGVRQDKVFAMSGITGTIVGPFLRNRFNREDEYVELHYVADPPEDLQLLVIRVLPGV